MPLLGSIYKRSDGLIESRIISPRQRPDRQVVGTSGSQGYKRKRFAFVPLAHLLLNGPHEVRDIDGNVVPAPKGKRRVTKALGKVKLPTRKYVGRVTQREDGRYEWVVKSANGLTVHVSHNQGFERAGKVRPDGTVAKGTALASLVEVCHGLGHEVNDTLL